MTMFHTRLDPTNRGDPFTDMRRVQREMNRLFDGIGPVSRSHSHPQVNFWVGAESIVMTAELPGLTQEEIDLTAQDKVISISGEYADPETGDDLTWHRRERPRGKFSRSIELPCRIDPDKVEARFEHGVLTVEMQRPDDEKPKRIKIKA
jgi:HSP20 family protein